MQSRGMGCLEFMMLLSLMSGMEGSCRRQHRKTAAGCFQSYRSITVSQSCITGSSYTSPPARSSFFNAIRLNTDSCRVRMHALAGYLRFACGKGLEGGVRSSQRSRFDLKPGKTKGREVVRL